MSDLLCHPDGLLDIPVLLGLVTAAKQNDECVASPSEIEPVAGPVVDAKLADAAEYFASPINPD
jgi:hypothetical protein